MAWCQDCRWGQIKGHSAAGLDANALLQARFRQRLLQREPVNATAGPMVPCHVALSSATWAVLLRTTAQLLHGTSTDHGHVSAGQPVIFHLPGDEKARNGADADEAVGERMRAPHAVEHGSAGALADVRIRGEDASGSPADQRVKTLLPKQGRIPKVARKSIREFREQLLTGQVEQEPDQGTAGADGDSDWSKGAASREGATASQEDIRAGQAGAVHGAVPTPKKDMPAPSRASRRLEARRCSLACVQVLHCPAIGVQPRRCSPAVVWQRPDTMRPLHEKCFWWL